MDLSLFKEIELTGSDSETTTDEFILFCGSHISQSILKEGSGIHTAIGLWLQGMLTFHPEMGKTTFGTSNSGPYTFVKSIIFSLKVFEEKVSEVYQEAQDNDSVELDSVEFDGEFEEEGIDNMFDELEVA